MKNYSTYKIFSLSEVKVEAIKKKWICPLCGQPKDRRGAPGHISIKHSIPWKEEYLNNPEFIKRDQMPISMDVDYQLERFIFTGMDYRRDPVTQRAVNSLMKHTFQIRSAYASGDRQAIHRINLLLIEALEKYELER